MELCINAAISLFPINLSLISNLIQVEDLKKQCSSLKTLTERQEQVLSKKEKQIQEQNEPDDF